MKMKANGIGMEGMATQVYCETCVEFIDETEIVETHVGQCEGGVVSGEGAFGDSLGTSVAQSNYLRLNRLFATKAPIRYRSLKG